MQNRKTNGICQNPKEKKKRNFLLPCIFIVAPNKNAFVNIASNHAQKTRNSDKLCQQLLECSRAETGAKTKDNLHMEHMVEIPVTQIKKVCCFLQLIKLYVEVSKIRLNTNDTT